VRRIIITAEPVTDIDVTSADMLAELEHTLTESGALLGRLCDWVKLPRKPPTIAPAMPMRIVTMIPPGSFPGW
jgi:hypothetical protein